MNGHADELQWLDSFARISPDCQRNKLSQSQDLCIIHSSPGGRLPQRWGDEGSLCHNWCVTWPFLLHCAPSGMPSSLGSSGLKPAWPSAPSRVPCPHSLPMSLYHTTISLLSLILGHLLWFFSLNYLKNNLSAMMGGAQRMPESPGPRALSFTEVGWELRSLAYTFGVLPSISTNDTYTTFSSCSCCLFTECSFWHFSPPPHQFPTECLLCTRHCAGSLWTSTTVTTTWRYTSPVPFYRWATERLSDLFRVTCPAPGQS